MTLKDLGISFVLIMATVTLFAFLCLVMGLLEANRPPLRKILRTIGQYYLLGVLSSAGFLGLFYLIECSRRW